jgi:hypothetical protein
MFHMSEPVQTFQNHARFDPLFHFFLAPVSIILLIWSLVHVYKARTIDSILIAAGFLVLFVAIGKMRGYSLKVQDRVIRLEERLRLQALCSGSVQNRIPELTEKQLIALRFASDGEAATLATKAMDERLAPKQIKAAVQKWRADHFRV